MFQKVTTFEVPGVFIGCYAVEATLQSNLASFYNQSWVIEFRTAIQFETYSPVSVKTTALNASLDSQYNLTTPIMNMLQKMMMEKWDTNVNYSAYYEQCHPTECKYTYIVKYDLVYIITTMIGLVGGLTTILQLIIPRAVKLSRRALLALKSRRIRIQVNPTLVS